MFIKQKRIQNPKKILGQFKKGQTLKIIAAAEGLSKNDFEQLGFSNIPQDGETILPKARGKVSTFNAYGRHKVRKDIPKESRYVNTIEWTWKQWAGRGHTRTVTEARDVYRECYQQEFIEPPSIEISFIENPGGKYFCSKEFRVGEVSDNLLKHAVNLFLELFSACEIRSGDLSKLSPLKIKKVNWTLLPPGKYPWDRVKQHVQEILKQKDPRVSNVVKHRQDVLAALGPDEVFVGHGGFRAYLAYVFEAKGLVVLESITLDNAIYVFDEDWANFAKLTKAEILRNNCHKARIIHCKGWERKLYSILGVGGDLFD